jgi:hypothetical protein
MAQIQEPPSAYAAQYPFNNVRQTDSGHFQEFDDTPGAERIRTQHRQGTFVEWQPDGTEVHKILGKGYRIVAQDDNVIIQGQCNINIVGNAEVTIQGDAITNIQGNQKTVVEKDCSLLVKGDYNVISGGNITFTNDTSSTINMVTSRVSMGSNLTVHGKIMGDDIYSDGAVTAGTGIHAGVPGSTNPVAGISTLGGLNVGLPAPTVPGTVTATVLVTAPVVVGTVMVYGGILSDPEGGAPLIRTIYDSHTHIGNLGSPTSPAIPAMP